MIDVVSAVMIRGGRIFLAQREEGKDFEFTWETPGGSVEEHEADEEALKRELFEELGARPDSIGLSPIFTDVFQTENLKRPERAKIRLTFYLVEIGRDRLMPREKQPGFGWFAMVEARNLNLAPGTRRAWMLIEKEMIRAGVAGR